MTTQRRFRVLSMVTLLLLTRLCAGLAQAADSRGAAPAPGKFSPGDKPNIILILVDDMGYGDKCLSG